MSVVLVIDDDDDLREVLCDFLLARGFQVVGEADAGAALARLRAGLVPCVILLDLMMPGMTGWEFRAEQRRDVALARVPVVVLTARTVPSLGGQPPLGDTEVIHKPFSSEQLVTAVRRYCECST